MKIFNMIHLIIPGYKEWGDAWGLSFEKQKSSF
jgi:hypothetical protein